MAWRCRAVVQRTRHHRLTSSGRLLVKSVATAEYRSVQAPPCHGSRAHRPQRPRQSVAWSPAVAARSCAASSRCAWWPQHITAFVMPAGWRWSVRTARLRSAQTGCRLAGASCWCSRSPRLGRTSPQFGALVARACYGTCFAALRVYIGCCFTKWSSVAAPGLRLVPSTAVRPLGFIKPILCKVPALGAGASAVGAPPVASAPYAPPPGCPGGWRGVVASVRRCAQWPWCVACGQLSCVCPAHPWASPRFAGLGPALGLPVRPQGAPSAQRKYFMIAKK